MSMQRTSGRVVSVIALCAACAAAPVRGADITVFAAASLTEAFTEIGAQYEAAHPGERVHISFAGSQRLALQIQEGAPADIFASAAGKDMKTVAAAGLLGPRGDRVFLENRLVIVLAPGNPAEIRSFEDLAKPGLRLVLGAEEVPIGMYTRQVLSNMAARVGAGFDRDVRKNAVSNEETVKLVLAKVKLGEADAGIVYASDAASAPELGVVGIPGDLNVIARYPMAVLAGAPNPEGAARFAEFVTSPQGQAVLVKWGFTPVAP